MSKYCEIAELIKRRIRQEDYTATHFPGIRKLAEDTGVSYLTARQAVLKLTADGVLLQKENGYFSVNPQWNRDKAAFKVAFLTHHRASDYYVWENAVMAAAGRLGVFFRQVYYTHDDDPVIAEVLSSDFDLIFFKHNIMQNPFCRNLVLRHREKVVSLFQDLTEFGVRCFDGAPPDDAARLVDHLYELGHRKFATVKVAGDSNSGTSKIAAWERRLRQYGLKNTAFEVNCPHSSYTLIPAYEQAGRIVDAENRPTAIFCTALELAIGLNRYCHDRGLVVGRDLSVCSFGQPEMARMQLPSITVIDRPPPTDVAEEIIRDAMNSDGGEPAKLMYRTGVGNLIIGESTGPLGKSNPSKKGAL